MKLHKQIFPENLDQQTLADSIPTVIIPGLFGSIANWRSFARNLSSLSDHTSPVIVIDQRNHGRSPHSNSHSYDDMVGDLFELCEDLQLERVILCGHSMGGKVAMLFTQSYPHLVEKMLVLDIAPIKYLHSHAPFLEELSKIDLSSLRSRNEADKLLQNTISDTPTRLFLLQSLTGSPGSYHWRLNLSVLHRFMEQITDFESKLQVVENKSLFVSGRLSDYLKPEHHELILEMFPNSQFESIPDAGHWLHAEQPEKVLNVVWEFVKK